MIIGAIYFGEGRIRLKVKGIRGREEDVEAVIDTGYTGSLTLPSEIVSLLALDWRSVDRGTLADGSECLFDVYEAKVLWDGKARQILIDETNADPLLGMRLLKGYELRMQIRERGKVTIAPLNPRK